MLKLFKNRNFFLLFQGALVSAIGNSLYGFAAGLYVQDRFKLAGYENPGTYFALFVFSSILINVVCSPFAGVLVDKVNKIRVLYITDWIRGILFSLIFVLLFLDLELMTLFYILLGATIISSFNQAFFSPASASVMPEIVGEENIQVANGALSIINSVQIIAGVIAGMFLYEILGFEYTVLINAISFVLSAISEMFIRRQYEPIPQKEEKLPFFEEFKFGIRFIKGKEGFLTMMLFSLALNFAFTPLFTTGLPVLLRTELGATTWEIGISEIVFSIAMLIGGITVGNMTIKKLNSTVKRGIASLAFSFIVLAIVIVLVTYGIISYTAFFICYLVANVLLAITMMYTNIPLNTALMKAVDPDIRGRVFGALGALSQGAMPIALLLTTVLYSVGGNTAHLAIACSIVIVIVTIMYFSSTSITNMLDSLDEKDETKEIKEELIEAY